MKTQTQSNDLPMCTCDVCGKSFIPKTYSQTSCVECIREYADMVSKESKIMQDDDTFGI